MASIKSEDTKAMRRPPPTFADGTLSNAMTTVIVGTEKEAFVAYSDLLSYYSPKIQSTIGRHDLRLRDVSPSTFRIFLDWVRSDGNKMPKWDIHERRSCHLNEPREVEDIDFPGDLDEYYHKQPEAEAVDCYIFAYKYDIRLFMNDLFDSILEMNPFSNVVPSYSVVLKVWNELPATSHLRKYLIELFARVWTHETDVGCLEELILRKLVLSDFWLSILMQRSEHGELDGYPSWEENLCQYHDHDEHDPETCYWQLINGGHGYCTESSDSSSDSEMEDYEADFIDDDEVESNTVDNADTQPIEGMEESLFPSSSENSSMGKRSSSGTVTL